MKPKIVIRNLRRAGLRLAIRGGHLGVDPIAQLGDNLRQHIREQRDAIVLAVKNAPTQLVHLAIVAGIHEQGMVFTTSEIRRLQGRDDLLDAINCNRAELQGWASALAIRATQRRSKVPRGWNQTAQCKQCGSVPAHHNQAVLSCGWCWLRGDK